MNEHAAGGSGFVDRVTENAFTRLLTKVILPTLSLFLLPLVAMQWNDLKGSVGTMGDKVDKLTERQAATDQRVATIDTKLDAGLIWRLTQLENRFDAMEARSASRDARSGDNPH